MLIMIFLPSLFQDGRKTRALLRHSGRPVPQAAPCFSGLPSPHDAFCSGFCYIQTFFF